MSLSVSLSSWLLFKSVMDALSSTREPEGTTCREVEAGRGDEEGVVRGDHFGAGGSRSMGGIDPGAGRLNVLFQSMSSTVMTSCAGRGEEAGVVIGDHSGPGGSRSIWGMDPGAGRLKVLFQSRSVEDMMGVIAVGQCIGTPRIEIVRCYEYGC